MRIDMIDLKDVKLVLTPQQMAEEFAEMDSDDQARFFNRLAILVASWAGSSCDAQMKLVTDSKLLSAEGLSVMDSIGHAAQRWFAVEPGAQKSEEV